MPKIFIPLTQQKFIILLKRVIEGKKKIIKYEDISRDWSQEEAETKIQLYKDILGRTPRKTTDIDKALRDIFVFEDEEGTKKLRKSPVRKSVSASRRISGRKSTGSRKSRSRK